MSRPSPVTPAEQTDHSPLGIAGRHRVSVDRPVAYLAALHHLIGAMAW